MATKSFVKQPPTKQARIFRTDSVPLETDVGTLMDAGKIRASSSEGSVPQSEAAAAPLPSTDVRKVAKPGHPRGHKVRTIAEVWKAMDDSDFWRVTDTLQLDDVWVQPQSCTEVGGAYTTVNVLQLIAAPNYKSRHASTKMSVDELLRILYLGYCLSQDIQGLEKQVYDSWLAEKTADFVRAKGVGDSTNKSKLCNYILMEDPNYSLATPHTGIFFRKICYHSYKGEKGSEKIKNPSMIKCQSVRGKFDYLYEARIFATPDSLYATGDEEMPTY